MPDSDLPAAQELDRLASVAERLAVLLSAGVSPVAAWGYLAETEPPIHSRVVRIAGRLREGLGIPEAILGTLDDEKVGALATGTVSRGPSPERQDDVWRGLAAAWVVATDAGAPLARSLNEHAVSLRALADARRAAASALAGPAATAKLVVILPIVGILFGIALGFNTVGTLVSTTPGLVCLGAGCALLWVGRTWSRRLVMAATATELNPGLALDLLAIAVSGGASIGRAQTAAHGALEQCGLAPAPRDIAEAHMALDLSRRAGVPAGSLLRSEANRVRREAGSTAERRAATLAVTLMLPLGLCVLPAFMLLGVAPLMLSILSSTMTGS